MKKFLLGVLFIAAGVTLLSGKMHWEEKVYSVQAKEDSRVKVSINENVSQKMSDSIETVDLEEKRNEMIGKNLERIKLLPIELQQPFSEVIQRNQPVGMTIIGSSSVSTEEGAWPRLLEKELLETYGESIINVSTIEIKNKTSDDILNEKLLNGVAESNIDVLLLEPFLLYDNGKVSMAKRLKNLTALIDMFKKQNPNITILLQPPNPVYGAYYYPREEYDLERYAKNNQLIYLNHWDAWPDYNSEEVLNYLENEGVPNEKGNEVWAKYLIDYFIKEEV